MAKVDLKQLEEEAKKKKVEEPAIEEKRVGEKLVFRGPQGEWYDVRGEALAAHIEYKRQLEYKKLGLNEFGQSKEEIEKQSRIRKLIEKRNEIIESARKIDIEIGNIRSGVELNDPKRKK